MQNGHPSLINDLRSIVHGDPFWEGYLHQVPEHYYFPFALHLAILVEPYLQFILDGKKTVESRFSTRRYPPYKSVYRGDVILLKQSGGPIVGVCQVADAWFYHLDTTSWKTIKEEFAQAICAQDPLFWKDREHASFATLIRMKHVRSLMPIQYTKRDRRGWVILQAANEQLRFDEL